MVRKITDYENILFNTISLMLGLDPLAEITNDRIRTTYGVPGQAEFNIADIADSIIFIKIFLGGDSYDNTIYEDVKNQVIQYTRTFTMVLTAYGPTSSEDLDRVRLCFMSGQYLLEMKQANIFPVMQPPSVSRIPELFEGRYWERADLNMVFYAREDTSADIPYIESTEITVLTENDERRTINA